MSVSIQDFGKSTSGQTVKLATLKNDFIEVQLLSYAAIIHRIIVKDRKGNPVDVVLGYDTAADYELNTDSMGAAVGRFANRIAGAQFPLYEEIVHITPNQNGNCLHSGLHGFNHTMFDVALTPGETDSVTMTATSPAGTDGFPGNFELTIQYSLAKSGLVIRYGATTDAPTVCNMTNHSYFNLNGHASGSALGHRVTVDADFYLEADAASIPTGRKLPVKAPLWTSPKKRRWAWTSARISPRCPIAAATISAMSSVTAVCATPPGLSAPRPASAWRC